MVPRVEDAVRALRPAPTWSSRRETRVAVTSARLRALWSCVRSVKAVAPVPVLAAGGFVDGAGLAAALSLGAAGVLLGTRFLATDEASVEDAYKEAIVASNGSDTIVTTVGDTLSGRDWPGAWARLRRTRFVEEWLGREPELRRRRAAAWARLEETEESDPDYGLMWIGQSAGLVDEVLPAGEVVRADRRRGRGRARLGLAADRRATTNGGSERC